MKLSFQSLLLCLLISCAGKDPKLVNEKLLLPVELDFDELFHQTDSIVREPEVVKMYNSALDTIIVDEGVFSYLKYDYHITFPKGIVDSFSKAIHFEQKGDSLQARKMFNYTIKQYNTTRMRHTSHFSCGNDYNMYNVNFAIICAYSLNQIGQHNKSLEVLEPFMANNEVGGSKIIELYLQYLKNVYSIEEITEEIEHRSKSFYE